MFIHSSNIHTVVAIGVDLSRSDCSDFLGLKGQGIRCPCRFTVVSLWIFVDTCETSQSKTGIFQEFVAKLLWIQRFPTRKISGGVSEVIRTGISYLGIAGEEPCPQNLTYNLQTSNLRVAHLLIKHEVLSFAQNMSCVARSSFPVLPLLSALSFWKPHSDIAFEDLKFLAGLPF